MKEKSIFEGKLIVLTAPSGGGKTTIKRHLLETYDDLGFSVSVTTRDKRPNESDGVDYYFKTSEEFYALRDADAFVEWEEVYEGLYYGTLKSEVDRLWRSKKHIIFDIDVKGAMDIKKLYADQCLAIFIRPPSIQVIVERLKARGTETEESLAKRIKRIEHEMSYESKFDTILVNDLLPVALKESELKIEGFLTIEKKSRVGKDVPDNDKTEEE